MEKRYRNKIIIIKHNVSIITTTAIMIIALKGATRDFFTISSPRRKLSEVARRNRVQITCNTSGAHHVQHIMCYLVRRESSAVKFDRLEIAFIVALGGGAASGAYTAEGHVTQIHNQHNFIHCVGRVTPSPFDWSRC